MSKIFFSLLALTALTFAAEDRLVSNFTFAVGKGSSTGSLWVLSRGDAGSGLTLLTLSPSATGVHATGMAQEFLGDEETPVQDGIFSDLTAEHRRTVSASAGALGWVLPLFSINDSASSFIEPAGILSSRAINSVYSTSLDVPTANIDANYLAPMNQAVSGLAYDSTTKVLWIARGILGLTRYDISSGASNARVGYYVINAAGLKIDTLTSQSSIDGKKNPSVFGLALHPETSALWLATERGLYQKVRTANTLTKLNIPALDTGRVTGVWIGGTPTQIIAETSVRSGSSTQSHLWRSWNGAPFKEVVFKDTVGKVQKNIYDKADYSVSAIAFVGSLAFLSVQTIEGSISGLLKLDSNGAIPWDNENQWLYALDAGVVDRSTTITSVSAFPLTASVKGIAVSTYGAGISVSADTGKTWSYILNQAAVNDNLGSIRMVPSVIVAGGTALVAYKVGKDANITIEIFSYDMRKVRTIVKSVFRPASSTRSSLATEDFWDGYDDHGRAATMGIYYVRVKDNHDHVGWGKVMTLGGSRR